MSKRPNEGTLTRQIWDWLDSNPGASKEELQGAFPERPWGTLSTQSSRWRKSVMAQGRTPQRQGRLVPALKREAPVAPSEIDARLSKLADGKDSSARWHIYIDGWDMEDNYNLTSYFFSTRDNFAAAIKLLQGAGHEFEVCIFCNEDPEQPALIYSTHDEITKMLGNENY